MIKAKGDYSILARKAGSGLHRKLVGNEKRLKLFLFRKGLLPVRNQDKIVFTGGEE